MEKNHYDRLNNYLGLTSHPRLIEAAKKPLSNTEQVVRISF